MNVHEWPLTFFTIMAQMAVGGFIGLGFIQVFARTKFGQETVDRMNQPALYALGPIMVLALLCSMFHLGNPFNAPNAIRHLQTSWLAREILFGAGFAGLGFVFAVVTWFKLFNSVVRTILAAFTALWGVAFIWVMSNVYLLETVPAWNNWTTPAQFYLTTFLLGILSLGVAYTTFQTLKTNKLKPEGTLSAENGLSDGLKTLALTNATLRWIGMVATLLLVGELVVASFVHMQPAGPNPAVVPFSGALFALRMGLLIAGVAGLGFFLTTHGSFDLSQGINSDQTKILAANRRLQACVTVAFILVFASEVIGRFMFYGAMDRIGI